MLIKLVIVNLEECSYIQVISGGGACISGGCSYIQVNAGGGACIYGGCSYIQVNALILWRTHIYLSERSYIPASAHILDRKSTRLNSSHVAISYAVFCLKKKNKDMENGAPAQGVIDIDYE